MREILFRGKAVEDLKWVEGFYFREAGEFIKELPSAVTTPTHLVYPETVGQYTGVTANGTKIFEGDILKFTYTGQNHGVEGVAVVEFENGKFGVKWGWHKEFIPLDGFANTTIEVIGNIHDNPELLEGE